MSWFGIFRSSAQAPTHKETTPPVRSETIIIGGTNRTGEESVGARAPHPNTQTRTTSTHAVYETREHRTTVFPGAGVIGSPLQRIRELFTGNGHTGIDSTASRALELTSSSSNLNAIGYSRGAVAVNELAQRREERGLSTVIDTRDPVRGGGSDLTPVGPLIHGRQQMSLGNILPGFGTSLLDGPGISTVLTEGGHSAFARDNFTRPLSEGTLGRVTILDGHGPRLAMSADVAHLRRFADEIDRLSVVDDESAMTYAMGRTIPTTQVGRYRTVANLIERTNPLKD